MTEQDLTPVPPGALGRRIDDAAPLALTTALGRKPFKTATLNNTPMLVDRKHGMQGA